MTSKERGHLDEETHKTLRKGTELEGLERFGTSHPCEATGPWLH